MFSCPFDRYRYNRLPFGASPGGNMFQKKINKLLSGISNVFSIADNILITGFDEQGKDHYETLNKILKRCRQATSKLKNDKCLFRCTNIPFFGKNNLLARLKSGS